MKAPRKSMMIAVLCALTLTTLSIGVFANTTVQINGGSGVALGASNPEVKPCDNDVDIQPILLNDGETVYLQGFQFDNADKPGCVGYDFETRFVTVAGGAASLFATSSITSEPTLVRVFSATSSANWQLGLGAQPSVEATVTQLTASSFKVIFTTPLSLATDIGRIAMAEITHLPLGTFTAGYSEVGAATGNWTGSCIVANATKFYALEQSNGLYQSSVIPAFPGSVASVTTSRMTSSAIPASGILWYALGCSASGQYLAIGGTSNQISYSKDYGVTWESRTVSTFNPGTGGTAGTNNAISISADGKVVALSTGGSSTGYYNFWVNGNFWTSPTTVADGIYASTPGGTSTVKVCSDGTTIYGGGGTGSGGLFRWAASAVTSGGNKASVSPAYTSSSFGTYIRSIGCSADGQSAVIASSTNSQVYVTRNQFTSSYSPVGLATTNQGDPQKPYTVSMSSSGRFVAVGTGSSSTLNTGTTQSSTDFGQNLTNTSFINRYMQTITIADDGSRIVTGGGGYAPSTKIVILGSN